MRPLYLLALAAAAAALQFSPVKPLRRRALQRRIRREADFISSPARGMDPEVLDDLVRKHNNLVEELRNLDEPARPRSTAAVAGPNAHRVPINKKPVFAPRKAVRNFAKMPPAKKAAAVGAAVGAAVIAL